MPERRGISLHIRQDVAVQVERAAALVDDALRAALNKRETKG
jgi:hypothetical protein